MLFLEKTVENVIKPRDIKLVTTKRRKNYLGPEPNFCSYYNVFHRKSITKRNLKNWNTNE